MFGRDSQYYGIINDGLSAIGYTGATAFDMWVNDTYANKYNMEKSFKEMGFGLDPSLPISATYEQMEVEVRPYTMAAYVDIDSDGPTKHTDGASLKLGNIPTFKHEITMTRKTMREMAQLREMLNGTSNDTINQTVVDLMFNGVDKLLGGNYNTFAYQRHQIVSNGAKLVIGAHNNPTGVPLLLDFGVERKNIKNDNNIYTISGESVVEGDNAKNLLSELKDIKRKATLKDHCPAGHFEVAQKTWDETLQLTSIRSLYAQMMFPTAAADSEAVAAYAALATDDAINGFIEKHIGCRIVVIDAIGSVEAFKNGKIEVNDLPAFKEGYFVYVPDGEIGTAQFGKPFALSTPGALDAFYDGGRTWLRTIFDDDMMNYVIKSEVTGLCVPNKVRWMYYYQVNGSLAAKDKL